MEFLGWGTFFGTLLAAIACLAPPALMERPRMGYLRYCIISVIVCLGGGVTIDLATWIF